MNMRIAPAALSAAALALVLGGCTTPQGDPYREGTGGLMGGATGAAIGGLIGRDATSALVGGAVGAIAGGVIGRRLDEQAHQLDAVIAASGATVTNYGDRVVVHLPEAITFPVSEDTIRPEIRDELIAVSHSLQQFPDTTVKVIGHTDSSGTSAYNTDLSQRRAMAVTDILVASGTPSNRIRHFGLGYNQPIASNATEEGRAENRRVEIVIIPS